MKKMLWKFLTLALVVSLLLIFNTSCKKSVEATNFGLTVIIGEGATGTPETGSYTYQENDTVDYEYFLKDKYMNLLVKLDSIEVPTSGTITITDAHTLEISAEPVPGDRKLTVATSIGVTGTPERGTFYYDIGETINYEYKLEDCYINLRVKLDNEAVPSVGSITFDEDIDRTLVVLADRYFEIRGTWTIQEFYDDDSTFIVTLTFEGADGMTGTVTDSDGGTGTYTVTGPSVAFNIDYPDVQYTYTGNFTGENNMQGNGTRLTPTNSFTGIWSAARESTDTTSMRSTESGKWKVRNVEAERKRDR
jgi:hypothetical protein